MLPMTAEVEPTTGKAVRHTAGFFITQVVHRLPDGRQRVYHSRPHRKGLPPVEVGSEGIRSIRAPLVATPWLHLWAPHRLTWWVAQLFIIGSACFALASFASNWPQYAPAGLTGSGVINTVFFVGSLFFTGAAWLQLLEAINGDVADIDTSSGIHEQSWRWLAWKPYNAGYSASLIQFVGTLLFNVNTADAMISGLTWAEEDILIWAPNIIGSICFLVASYLALIEVSHRLWSFQPRQLSWWIVMLNLLGSVAFMLAALYGFFPPSNENPEWTWDANFFTLLGAVCFLVASYLMIPELFGAGRAIDTPSSSPAN
jgi:hypothetical protein